MSTYDQDCHEELILLQNWHLATGIHSYEEQLDKSWRFCSSPRNNHLNISFTLATPAYRFFPFPEFCVYHTFSLRFCFLSCVRNMIHKMLFCVWCSGHHSIDWLQCTQQETPQPCFPTRSCSSESLNFSEYFFSLFGSDCYMTTVSCTAAPSSLWNHFKYQLVHFFHSSKYGCNTGSFISTPNMLTS